MEVRRGSVRRGRLTGGAHGLERKKSGIPLWRLFILHGGVEKFFGTYDFILRKFDFVLPKFHFILPKFYFAPPWGIFVFS